MRLIINIILFFALAVCPALTATAQDNRYKHDAQHPFIVISDDTVSQAPTFDDKGFYHYSTNIQFEVSKSVIDSNHPFLRLYNDVILPRVNREHLQLRKVFIRGAASPEGPYEFNRQLGQNRSQALLTELRRNLLHQYLESDLEVNSVTEDYGLLCILMEEANDRDYSAVKQIYDECQGDELCCKQKLMAAQKGALWARLKRTYFPKLRSARFILWFSKPDKKHDPVYITKRDTVYIKDTVVVSHTTVIDNVNSVSVAGYQSVGAREAVVPRVVDTEMHHPLFALKTNLLFDAATLVNGEIEVPLSNRYSLMAETTWPWWLNKSHNKWCIEMGNVGIEGRLWFRKWQRHSTFTNWRTQRNAPLSGWFVGIYGHAGYFDFQFKRHEGTQGEFAGAGISLGYSSYIGKHWRMEFSVGGGVAFHKDRKYTVDDPTPVDPTRDQHLWRNGAETKHTWLGPTKAKISLSYILTRKCKKGGNK